jgi:excinuclease ABC subunit A
VLVIEHDLDLSSPRPTGSLTWAPRVVMAEGASLVAAGTPEDVVRAGTHTGVALAPGVAARR